MRYELKPTPMQDGSTLYGVLLTDRTPPRFVGWIRPLPMDGWTLAGYDDDPSPYFRSQGEAVDGLVERDSQEQDAADWPVILGLGIYGQPQAPFSTGP